MSVVGQLEKKRDQMTYLDVICGFSVCLAVLKPWISLTGFLSPWRRLCVSVSGILALSRPLWPLTPPYHIQCSIRVRVRVIVGNPNNVTEVRRVWIGSKDWQWLGLGFWACGWDWAARPDGHWFWGLCGWGVRRLCSLWECRSLTEVLVMFLGPGKVSSPCVCVVGWRSSLAGDWWCG